MVSFLLNPHEKFELRRGAAEIIKANLILQAGVIPKARMQSPMMISLLAITPEMTRCNTVLSLTNVIKALAN